MLMSTIYVGGQIPLLSHVLSIGPLSPVAGLIALNPNQELNAAAMRLAVHLKGKHAHCFSCFIIEMRVSRSTVFKVC